MSERFALVPASYVYLLRPAADGREGDAGGDEVLLQLRGDVPYMGDHWAAAAAGHVEPGETAYDGARREAMEELGLADVDLRFELTMQRTMHAEAIEERVDFFFSARSWSGEPTILEADKCRELRWCRLDALPEPMVPHEAHALAHLGGQVRYLTHGFRGVARDAGGAGRSTQSHLGRHP